MEPNDTSARYDRIAQWWQTEHQHSTYGIAQLERAKPFLLSSTQHLMSGVEAADVLLTVYPNMDFSLKDLIFLAK